jgi:hypothetical protein
MNRDELQSVLEKNQVAPIAYSLGGGLPNEKYVLDQGIDKWSVYYSERGQKSGERIFNTEDAACQYIQKLLMNDLSTRK